MSVFFTSPALLGAALAPWRRDNRTWLLLGAAVAALIPTLLYYGGGWLQYGYRYFLDSIPFIWALCAMAVASRGWVGYPGGRRSCSASRSTPRACIGRTTCDAPHGVCVVRRRPTGPLTVGPSDHTLPPAHEVRRPPWARDTDASTRQRTGHDTARGGRHVRRPDVARRAGQPRTGAAGARAGRAVRVRDGPGPGDRHHAVPGRHASLAGDGTPYLPNEVAAPFQFGYETFLHPPVSLLFLPFLYLPIALWWAIPIGAVVWSVWSWRPTLDLPADRAADDLATQHRRAHRRQHRHVGLRVGRPRSALRLAGAADRDQAELRAADAGRHAPPLVVVGLPLLAIVCCRLAHCGSTGSRRSATLRRTSPTRSRTSR